jgi:hypothetical protein
MGWWDSDKSGDVWGDGPADIMDAAVERVLTRLTRTRGRSTAVEELGMWIRPCFNPRLTAATPWVWMSKIMEMAERGITKEFKEEWGRAPKRRELREGLDMALEGVVGAELAEIARLTADERDELIASERLQRQV